MTLVRPRWEILGGIALGVAVAATAMGVYNWVQIEQLKVELFKVKENTGCLFEVVQDFSQNMAALETGFNEIRTTLLYQVMFNPTLFDSPGKPTTRTATKGHFTQFRQPCIKGLPLTT